MDQDSSTHSTTPQPPDLSILSIEYSTFLTENFNLKKNSLIQQDLIKILEIHDCPTLLKASKLILNSNFQSTLVSLKYVNALKLKINEEFNEQDTKQNLINNFEIERNFLLSFESTKAEHERIIYWINEFDKSFISLKFINGKTQELTDYVRDFLIKNVNIKHSGGISLNDDLNLVSFRNLNGQNLLMNAVNTEQSVSLINDLLHLPFDINLKSFEYQSAADLAWQKKNFRILLRLLESNSVYPEKFDEDDLGQDEASIKIKEIFRVSERMHQAIKNDDEIKVLDIIQKMPNLRYFYSEKNKSAATIAIRKEKISIYEILSKHFCFIGPKEKMEDVLKNSSDRDKEKINKINSLNSIDYSQKHLTAHFMSAVTAPGDKHFKEHERCKIDAYKMLNEIELTQQLLKVTATHKNLRTHFDFYHNSVGHMNPVYSNKGTEAVCLNNGHIYIGAEKLRFENSTNAVIGCLAHEICHLAMNMTFCNDFKPYAIDDEANEQIFSKIVENYEAFADEYNLRFNEKKVKVAKLEDLIGTCKSLDDLNEKQILSYKNYSKANIPNYVDEIDKNCKVIARIENEIETLNGQIENADNREKICNTRLEIRDKKSQILTLKKYMMENQEKLNKCIQELRIYEKMPEKEELIKEFENDILQIKNEFKEFEEKVENEKIVKLVYSYSISDWPCELIFRVPHMIVHYKNDTNRLNELKVIFKELFDYYEDVVVPTMKQTQPILEKLFNNSTEIKFHDLTDAYKAKIHHSIFNFQEVDVKFHEIIEDKNSEIFQLFSSTQVRGILIDRKKLVIGYADEINTKCYIERYFVGFYDNQDYKFRLSENGEFPNDIWDEEYYSDDSFEQLTSNAEDEKMILLADYAGAGKTTTFKHFSVKLKEKYPNYWINYVDLKRHLKTYEKFEKNFNANQILKVLFEILDIDDELEIKIFTNLYNNDKVILLFDGVDEISPSHNDFFIKLIESINFSTENQQWIATRPQYTRQLENKFNQIAYKFKSYGDRTNLEFIKKIIQMNQSFNDDDAKKIAEDILKIIYKNISINLPNRDDNNVENPLIFKMITELYLNDKTIVDSFNLYSLYEKMLILKKKELFVKGEIANDDRDNEKSTLTIWQVHQIYALKLIYNKADIDELLLIRKWNKREKSNWTPEQISRYGFLIVDNWNNENEFPDFVHRTFAEFFIVHYFIENIYNFDDEIDEANDEEYKMRMKLLISVTCDEKFKIQLNFLKNYFKLYRKTNEKLYKYITSSDEMEKRIMDIRESFLPVHNKFGDKYIETFRNIQCLDDRFLADFRFKEDKKTIFQKFLVDYRLRYGIINLYKELCGNEWAKFTGYNLKENFSMPNDEEIDEVFKNDYVQKRVNEMDNYMNKKNNYDVKKRKCVEFYKVLCFIDQAKIPLDHLLEYFDENFKIFITIRYISLEILMRIFRDNFSDCKELFYDFLKGKVLSQWYQYKNPFIEDEDQMKVANFCKELLNFFFSQNDIEIFCIKFFIHICDLKSVECLYKKYDLVTQEQVQNYLIQNSVFVIENLSICYGRNILYDNIDEFPKNFFPNYKKMENDKNQLRKFFAKRYDDDLNYYSLGGHTVLSYIESRTKGDRNNQNEDYRRNMKIKRVFMKLARDVDLSTEEIEILSKRLNTRDSKKRARL